LVALVRTAAVAAANAAGVPLFFTVSKHCTAAIRSLISDDATKPTFAALRRRKAAV
jgi:hypothetical protein